MDGIKLAILGATGAVGGEMLKVLAERNFPVSDIKMLADANDAGKKIIWQGKEYIVEKTTPDSFEGVELTLVAVDNPISLMFSPEAVKRGSIVIDNSSAYRLDTEVPLVIAEVNPEDVLWNKGIIANPNCSTIICLVAIKPLYDYSKIKRMVVSTYQAVSGAGILGIEELKNQAIQYLNNEKIEPKVFAHQIAYNLIPQIDEFQDNGYTKEELKLLYESRKILHDDDILVSCTCVRVPVFRSHSESIMIETEEKISASIAKELLQNAPGVKLVDDPKNKVYPMPLDSSDQDLIFAGRIREDISYDNALSLWVCGDQIRKGAATNAIQIAELLVKNGLLK